MMDPFRQAFIQKIQNVFTTQLENDQIFVETAPRYFDADAAKSELFFSNWCDIPLEVLVRHRNHFAYLNVCGFHFYLPAILTACILHTDEVDTLVTNVEFDLTPPKPNQTVYPIFQARADTFTPDECAVIASYFENHADLFPTDYWKMKETERIKALIFWQTKADEPHCGPHET
ncbi:MAG: hypothetical protein CL607_06745 [Anaerolineaceae bacterium]|nr:hypothetical protein [Anaerolineaceae bacterium]